MKIQTTVGEIFLSFRYSKKQNGDKVQVCTTASISCNGVASVGVASSDSRDNFEKAIGRRISLTRALNAAKIPRSLRKEIWAGYFEAIAPKYEGQIETEAVPS